MFEPIAQLEYTFLTSKSIASGYLDALQRLCITAVYNKTAVIQKSLFMGLGLLLLGLRRVFQKQEQAFR